MIFVIYGVAPILTIFFASANMVLYSTFLGRHATFLRCRSQPPALVPLIYGIVYSSVMMVGWSVVMAVWSDCHVNRLANYPGPYCYTNWLDVEGGYIHGVPDAWIIAIMVMVASIVIMYVLKLLRIITCVDTDWC
jgi:hypothetical protein